MTSAVIACHAETCFSSLRLTSVSNRTSPALAIGSEIRRSLLLIEAWIERAESDDPSPSLLIDATSRLVASTWRHCHGVSWAAATIDRKSTRLNSSHSQISYAVFCLKKKKI